MTCEWLALVQGVLLYHQKFDPPLFDTVATATGKSPFVRVCKFQETFVIFTIMKECNFLLFTKPRWNGQGVIPWRRSWNDEGHFASRDANNVGGLAVAVVLC